MARQRDLDEGDSIEFSETIHIEPERGVDVWLKMGGSTTVRPGESGSKALDRLAGFIERKMEQKSDEWFED